MLPGAILLRSRHLIVVRDVLGVIDVPMGVLLIMVPEAFAGSLHTL